MDLIAHGTTVMLVTGWISIHERVFVNEQQELAIVDYRKLMVEQRPGFVQPLALWTLSLLKSGGRYSSAPLQISRRNYVRQAAPSWVCRGRKITV